MYGCHLWYEIKMSKEICKKTMSLHPTLATSLGSPRDLSQKVVERQPWARFPMPGLLLKTVRAVSYVILGVGLILMNFDKILIKVDQILTMYVKNH